MSHTPGPWTFDTDIWWENTPGEMEQHGNLIVYPQNDEDLRIAEVNDRFDKKIGLANACLIAAAPELLKALKVALAYLGKGTADGLFDNCSVPGEKLLANIRETIAKAEGGAVFADPNTVTEGGKP